MNGRLFYGNPYNGNYFFTPGIGYNKVYFLGGYYCMERIAQTAVSKDRTKEVYRITKCNIVKYSKESDYYSKFSLMDVMDIFENSFFLEFLLGVMSNLMPDMDSIVKTMTINEHSDPAIYVTVDCYSSARTINIEDYLNDARLISNMCPVDSQEYYPPLDQPDNCDIEEDNEEDDEDDIDESCECGMEDVDYSNPFDIIVTQKFIWSTTQPVMRMETTLIFAADHNNEFSWYNTSIDWYYVYNTFISRSILDMMSTALGIEVNNINQYKDYMTFRSSFSIDASTTCLVACYEILPKSVLNHNIYYDYSDGHLVKISTETPMDSDKKNHEMTFNDLAVCLGTQNRNFLPLNLFKVYTTITNGEKCITTTTISRTSDVVPNYFILPKRCLTSYKEDKVVYTQDEFSITYLSIDTYKTDGKFCNRIRHLKTTYKTFVFPDTMQGGLIGVGENIIAIGILHIDSEEVLNANELTTNEDGFLDNLPDEIYDRILKIHKLTEKSGIILSFIRSLPTTREFIVLYDTSVKSKKSEEKSDSDIISEKKDEKETE